MLRLTGFGCQLMMMLMLLMLLMTMMRLLPIFLMLLLLLLLLRILVLIFLTRGWPPGKCNICLLLQLERIKRNIITTREKLS